MASPVYGKQFIRFAETALVPDTLALEQFVLVNINPAAPTEPPTLELNTGGGTCIGVLQQEFNLANTGSATDLARQATVATSGLLLVAADGGNMQTQNDALLVDSNGKSSSAGATVTVGGSTPIVRQQVQIGGVNMVLVSFN